MDATAFLHGAHLVASSPKNKLATSGDSSSESRDLGGIAVSFPGYLVKLFNSVMEECSEKEVTVSPRKGRVFYGSKTVMSEPGEEAQLKLQDLPVNLQLLVFSYLDARTLCTLACTCKYWRMLSEDSVLWMSRIKNDLPHWRTISHQTHPETHLEAGADMTYKEIYRKCCPDLQSLHQRKKSRFDWMPFTLSFWVQQKPPTVVMFGPGLESSTSSLVKRLLWDNKSPFTVSGMSPGQFEGFGSGMRLQMGDINLNLVVLYSSTKKEREAVAREGRQRCSKLLAQSNGAEENQSSSHELSFQMRELCKSTDAFVYVVDSSDDTDRVNMGDNELQAMMDERWTQSRAPLLVLSCTVNQETQAISCASVVHLLKLRNLTRPWQVKGTCVETLDGVSEGVKWLLGNVQSSSHGR